MMTVKALREEIQTNRLNDFRLQQYVKFFALNIETMPLGAEIAFKEYIRKGAEKLGIDIEDLQAVYNSYRKELTK